MTIVLFGSLATISTPVAFTTTEVVAMKGALPAPGILAVGTTISVVAAGTISATTAGNLQARLRVGTAGTIADTAVCASGTVGSVTTAVGWTARATFTVVTVGSGGTCIGEVALQVGANTELASIQTATTAINTTVANFLDFTLIGAGTSLPTGNAYSGSMVVAKS